MMRVYSRYGIDRCREIRKEDAVTGEVTITMYIVANKRAVGKADVFTACELYLPVFTQTAQIYSK